MLKIITSSGATYELPEEWALSDAGSVTFRNKLEDKAFAHGSSIVGDGKISGRTITVEFDMQGVAEEEHDTAVNQAYQYFAQTDYKLQVGRTDRVYRVAGLSKIKHKYQKGFKQRWSNIEVSLLLADPFRYASSKTTITKTYTEAQTATEITFINPSSVDVPLTFTFTPTVAMADITIEHVESGYSFTVKDTLLTNPAILTVDVENGTVWRDTNNAINAFSGLFLRALPGINTIKFTGDPGTVEIRYTPGWFV